MQRLDHHTTELAHSVEGIETEGWLDWLAAAPPAFALRHGVRICTVGGAVGGIVPGTDVLMYNRVVGLGISEAVTEGQIDSLISAYGEAGAARWMIQWCPSATPSGTVDLLRACGFQQHNNWAKLYRPADTALPEVHTSLRIERVGGDRADAFATVLDAAFQHGRAIAEWGAALVDRAGWRGYMAFDGAHPVACGALFVQGRAAWLGFGATLPDYRGLGAQSALVATRIAAARELGCETIAVETAEDLPGRPSQSYRNMRRLGFQLLYLRPNFVLLPGTPAPGLVAERKLFSWQP